MSFTTIGHSPTLSFELEFRKNKHLLICCRLNIDLMTPWQAQIIPIDPYEFVFIAMCAELSHGQRTGVDVNFHSILGCSKIPFARIRSRRIKRRHYELLCHFWFITKIACRKR